MFNTGFGSRYLVLIIFRVKRHRKCMRYFEEGSSTDKTDKKWFVNEMAQKCFVLFGYGSHTKHPIKCMTKRQTHAKRHTYLILLKGRKVTYWQDIWCVYATSCVWELWFWGWKYYYYFYLFYVIFHFFTSAFLSMTCAFKLLSEVPIWGGYLFIFLIYSRIFVSYFHHIMVVDMVSNLFILFFRCI